MAVRRIRSRRPAVDRLRALPALVLVLALGASTAACAGDHSSSSAAAAIGDAAVGTAVADVPMGDMHEPTTEEVAAAWDARPDYVRALPADWQAAYAFALASPEVLQWLPCYCGCGGMGHRSNLDCFYQRREEGPIVFEEHASYCGICVETANMAASVLREGKTMIQVRAAVDLTFGGSAPGTDTPLPPT